ncbi:MAG TPA: TetR/AcrR family transcriptional regulator [Ktedonobacterales bacterium]|nr:TetR/AcrR family transcriptional regulator [Ktedonobacterales bacterium]
MTSVSRKDAYAVKRNAILDTAQRLIYTTGYEQMTIQDVLDELQISKGAFYYYFDSKPALLDALVARMQDEVLALLRPIADDAHTSALERLRLFFPELARWKTERKGLVLELVRVLYSDDNALFRQKARGRAIATVAPLLAQILRQAIQEGVVTADFPDEIGEMTVCLVLDLSDTLAGLLLYSPPAEELAQRIGRTIEAYTRSLERMLGVPAGSVPLADADVLREWAGDREGS